MSLTRREFVSGLASMCALCSCSSTGGNEPAPLPKKEEPVAPAEPLPAQPAPAAGVLIPIPEGCQAPDGQAKVVLPQGDEVLIWHDAGGYHAVAAVCTHKGGEVFYDAARQDIQCPAHGSRFFFDGSVAAGPAKRALKSWKVKVEGGQLRVIEKG